MPLQQATALSSSQEPLACSRTGCCHSLCHSSIGSLWHLQPLAWQPLGTLDGGCRPQHVVVHGSSAHGSSAEPWEDWQGARPSHFNAVAASRRSACLLCHHQTASTRPVLWPQQQAPRLTRPTCFILQPTKASSRPNHLHLSQPPAPPHSAAPNHTRALTMLSALHIATPSHPRPVQAPTT